MNTNVSSAVFFNWLFVEKKWCHQAPFRMEGKVAEIPAQLPANEYFRLKNYPAISLWTVLNLYCLCGFTLHDFWQKNEIFCVSEYALKRNWFYWLTQTIIVHGSGSAGGWETRAREENSRPYFHTTTFTLADSWASQQTQQSIMQCEDNLIKNWLYQIRLGSRFQSASWTGAL